MHAHQLAFSSIGELSGMLASRKISAQELVSVFVDRIQKLDSQSHAFIEVTHNSAMEAAAHRDRHERLGHLDGIPFASKDLIDVANVRTTAGSRVLADNIAQHDATIISRMTAAGAISLGKLNLHEFAYGATGDNPLFGTCVNAYDHTRLAGGSSSGSAAAVAFGLVPAAFGTDTGGSVRVPAALSGLVGLKPTLGRISRYGVIPYCWTLDHVGIITRTVADAALLLGQVAGFDPEDPDSSQEPCDDYGAAVSDADRLAGMKVGVPRKFFFERADEEILSATEAVLQHLESRGASLVEVELPSMEHARTVSLTVQMPEALSFHSRYLADRGELYGEDFRAGLALGQCILAEHYVRAKRIVGLYRQQTNAVFEDVDILVTPTTPCIAPRLGATHAMIDGKKEAVGNAITRYTTFFNMTGHPAITMPSGMHSLGLPMGVQMIGKHFDEASILTVAAALSSEPQFKLPIPIAT
jgi:aspartyl-tRNA(Asn)/glutamyl-tRNA(Gln) amidotransferase subunit A